MTQWISAALSIAYYFKIQSLKSARKEWQIWKETIQYTKIFPIQNNGLCTDQEIDLGLIITSFMKIWTQEIFRKALKNKEKIGKKIGKHQVHNSGSPVSERTLLN